MDEEKEEYYGECLRVSLCCVCCFVLGMGFHTILKLWVLPLF